MDITDDKIIKAKATAKRLHGNVPYGGGGTMYEQVSGVAGVLEKFGGSEDAIVAAWLHKSWEKKRIAEGETPLDAAKTTADFGPQIAGIVAELRSEPDELEGESKAAYYQRSAAWAQSLTPAAREILLAEKYINFQTSRDNPNPKKPTSWHLEYCETRGYFVEHGLDGVNPTLFKETLALKTECEKMMRAKLAQENHADMVAAVVEANRATKR